ncbi:hypothetical protein ABH944_002021 [Caballeronia udeis]|uniref:Uncharacterized protein n=1 Tax=Caballeronia udeis TaxID=1232866 RepID=A0ABW8MFB3_9BURK
MNGEGDRSVDGIQPLVVAAVVIHDPGHDISPVPWPAALAAHGSNHRHERSQRTGVMH